MRPITFNKAIILKNMIIGVENIYIEDNFNYSMDGNDLKILGKITIKYLVNDGLNKKEEETDIDVDCVLTLAKIDCRKDLKKALKAIDEIALTDLQGENFYPVKTNENETEYYTKNN